MFTEDLSEFFRLDGFAIAATLNGAAVQGIFDAGFTEASLDGFGPASTAPSFTLASASVAATPEGQILAISSGPSAGNYRVANARHDGSGVCTLDLLLQR